MSSIGGLNELSLLFVEDSDDYREALVDVLNSEIGEVYAAKDANIGLSLYNQYKPDILLTDINMPKIDGIELASRIRSICSDTAIIFLTSHDDPYYMANAIKTHPAAYIKKPADVKEILDEIAKAYTKIAERRRELCAIKLLDECLKDKEALKIVTDNNSVLNMSLGLFLKLSEKHISLGSSSSWVEFFTQEPDISRSLTLYDSLDVSKKITFHARCKAIKELGLYTIELNEAAA